ncbi:MAG: iron-containing redox enzyme family protein [Rhodospirillales bacterium]|nr:iron-containing redox enzyme family protein [Rhodospirillales bacterium]
MATILDNLDEFERKLHELANAQFDSPEYKKILGLKWNRERARIYIVQRAYFVLNRRDCWAYVQGAAPFDVKQIIWDHEKEELMGDPERGLANHYTLGMMEGEAVGLTPDDFLNTPPLPGTAACCYAWIHLAKDRPWLEAIPVSAVLEISNSDEVIKNGAFSRQVGEKMRDDVGIPFTKQPNNSEHIIADVEHGKLLMKVVERHARTEETQAQVLKGAMESWRIERAFKGVLGEAMAACPD